MGCSVVSGVAKEAVEGPTPSMGVLRGEAMQAVASRLLKFEPRIFLKIALYSNNEF